jgi:predicted PurR-regulated permease PerM
MRADIAPWMVRGIGLAAGALLVLGLVQLATAAAATLLLVFVAILLASALEPIVGWIRSHLPLGRGPAILLVYAAFFVVVLALAFVVVPAAIGQFNTALGQLPPFIDRARSWAAEIRPAALSSSVTALINAGDAALHPTAPRPDEVVQLGVTVAEVAISVASVLTIVFFWLLEHARLQRYVLAFLPLERRAGARGAWNAVETRLGLWVRGQLTLMAAIGVATGIAYTVLGLPSALLLGLIAAITEAIPIVGPLLGAIPAVLVAATVSPELALVVAGVYVVLQFIEGNILVPYIMRNTIGVSPFLVLVSLLVGAAVGGVVGAMLAVPVVATVEVVLERLQAREIPVAQDPAGMDATGEETQADHEEHLPDRGPGKPVVDVR